MTTTCSPKKVTVLLFASLALNIFMLGFVAAKLPIGHHHPHHERGFSKHERDGDRQSGKGPRGPRAEHGRNFDGPPPFMSGGLFSKEELAAEKPFIDERLTKLRYLRKDFAEKLKAKDITAAQIEEHFVQTDAVMAELKSNLHQKMVQKLSAMSQEERVKFAERALKAEKRHHRDGFDKRAPGKRPLKERAPEGEDKPLPDQE